jgi:hypothetical protein
MSSQGQRLGRRHCCRKRLGCTVVNVITNGGRCILHHRSPLYLAYSCLVGCSESSPSFSSVTLGMRGVTENETERCGCAVHLVFSLPPCAHRFWRRDAF